ncbi:MAG TPA: hypothetical protein VNN80_25795, partial [Polyangiaceae bacterium]|nr:hypothetical protein [Polyangiaceae bacterium]
SAVASWKGWVLDVADQAYRLGSYPRPAWQTDAVEAATVEAGKGAHDDSGCGLASARVAAGGPALPLLGLATLLAAVRRAGRQPSVHS